VLRDNEHVVPGLYAAGECACVSVHGSNRLGTNSLLDINVFGRRAGIAAAEYALNARARRAARGTRPSTIVAWVEHIRSEHGNERVAVLRKALQETMDNNAQVFRTEATLKQALNDIHALRERYRNVITVQDKGKRYNTDLLEAIELGFLLDLAEVTVVGALEPQGVARRPRTRGLPERATTSTSCATPWRTGDPRPICERLRPARLQARGP
jgi:succinate dehydrogenase / fumarate reductase flavoprotein subunit